MLLSVQRPVLIDNRQIVASAGHLAVGREFPFVTHLKTVYNPG